jgi:type I restriction enzyme S subunit
MSYPRYANTKDSGVEWLGDVPGHWEVKRVRFVARLNPSKGETAALARDEEVSFLPMEAIGDDGTLDLERSRPIGDVETGYTYFREGDVTIAKITPCFENGKGAVMSGLTGGIGFGTTELIVARPRPDETTSTFLHWLFVSAPFRKLGEAAMYGAGGQKRVPDDFVRDFAMGFPSVSEQSAIAAFLDRQTAKIDALVAEQEKLIALLAEKRQAVISHAVTKGLNPAAPMKDSGIEWLGEVPEHWEVKRLKFLAHVQGGVAKGRDLGDADTIEVPFLRVANVQDGYLDLEEIATIQIASHELPRFALQSGDVLMNEGGDFDKLGRGHIWRGEIETCIHQNHVFAVRPRGVEPEWLNLLTSAESGRFYFMSRSKQSTNLASISSTNIYEFPMVFPPSAERLAIVEHVRAETARNDALTAEARRAIDLLKERRSALISAAVTGKIDVRGLVEAEAA